MSAAPSAPGGAAPSEASIYNDRYRAGRYRNEISGYERARWLAVERTLAAAVVPGGVRRVIDYGSGSGLFTPLLGRRWPDAEGFAADVSEVALAQACARGRADPDRVELIEHDRTAAETAAFDVVMSIEVIEHVRDLRAMLAEIARILRPGGVFVFTTPCANRGSLEHLIAAATGRIERSATGERRWSWEEPTHLRRLTSAEASRALRHAGFDAPRTRFRAHAASYLLSPLVGGRFTRAAEACMDAEHRWLGRVPCAASMVGVARRGGGASGVAAPA